MDATLKKQMEITATKVRMGIIEGVYNAKSGHHGGSLTVADMLTYLYFAKMNVDPANPLMPERDRLVLSKGHTAPALYAALAEKGYFDKVVTTNLTYLPPEIYNKPYFIEADMSKFIASLIDFMNHDVSLSNVHESTDKIHQILAQYNNRENVEIDIE